MRNPGGTRECSKHSDPGPEDKHHVFSLTSETNDNERITFRVNTGKDRDSRKGQREEFLLFGGHKSEATLISYTEMLYASLQYKEPLV